MWEYYTHLYGLVEALTRLTRASERPGCGQEVGTLEDVGYAVILRGEVFDENAHRRRESQGLAWYSSSETDHVERTFPFERVLRVVISDNLKRSAVQLDTACQDIVRAL